jgi:hypothetical protein
VAKLLQYRTVGQGNKLARVHKVELTRSQPKPNGGGNELMVKGQLKITEGKYEGEALFFQAMLEGKGSYYGGLKLAAIRPDIEWDGDAFPEDEDGNLDEAAAQAFLEEELLEEDVIAQVIHEPYNGKVSVKVGQMYPKNSDVRLEDDAVGEAA